MLRRHQKGLLTGGRQGGHDGELWRRQEAPLDKMRGPCKATTAGSACVLKADKWTAAARSLYPVTAGVRNLESKCVT